jgi:hypothetical protein
LVNVEDVLMVGYPVGIWDQYNNAPIFRKGITATHPALDYQGKKKFLIDAACFPGSSGSPVFIFNHGSYSDKKGGIVVGDRLYFLGILHAGPQYKADGNIEIVDIPTKNVMVSSKTDIPTNLGIVLRAELLLDFEKKFENL